MLVNCSYLLNVDRERLKYLTVEIKGAHKRAVAHGPLPPYELGGGEGTELGGHLRRPKAASRGPPSRLYGCTPLRPHMASSVGEELSIGRTLYADGAPPNDFRGFPEDNFNSQWLMQTEASLTFGKNVLVDQQRVLSDKLRAI